jgi:Cu(I)/Ag(I) efflux system membrane fusion protein
MKKSIFIALFTISIALVFQACINTTSKSPAVESKADEKAVYTCTMHPEVQKDKPGNCPKCGMELVKMDTADNTNMHDDSNKMYSH